MHNSLYFFIQRQRPNIYINQIECNHQLNEIHIFFFKDKGREWKQTKSPQSDTKTSENIYVGNTYVYE